MATRKTTHAFFFKLALFCALGFSPLASADTAKPFIIGGLAFGGENLAWNESEDLDAGGFLYFGGGAIVEPRNSSLMLQFSLGYKFDSIELAGASGHTSFSVLPVDAMLFLKANTLRFGAGLTYYLDPKWEVCAYGSSCLSRNFDNALGVAFELRQQWTDILFWGARYSSVEYEDDYISLDANNLRVHFGMMF